jgi:predicted enzyme related to lactoylglutathione lyase
MVKMCSEMNTAQADLGSTKASHPQTIRLAMMLLRVRNLDATTTQLRAGGIQVDLDPNPYPNGRFARFYDPEGNPVELWEPAGRDTPR